VFCLAEDRRGAEPGLRLLLLSLAQHGGGTPTFLYRPKATPAFTEWCRQFPWLELHPEAPPDGFDWNCKPQALLPLMARGFDEVVWLDSDLLLNRSLDGVLNGLDPATLLLAQDSKATNVGEYSVGSRTRAWGWSVARDLPMTLNTCILRVTREHRALLGRWGELLCSPEYLRWAKAKLPERPVGFVSDQEVLTALLGCPEFSSVPLRILATGSEVVHCAGARSFSPGDRWRWLTGGPAYLLHATTGKPWVILAAGFGNGGGGAVTRLAQEVSPYVVAAREYQEQLGEPARWLDHRTVAGRALGVLGLGSTALRGLPLTLAAGVLAPQRG
jgi:hypothetical protein